LQKAAAGKTAGKRKNGTGEGLRERSEGRSGTGYNSGGLKWEKE
jgi:hypothetical protein